MKNPIPDFDAIRRWWKISLSIALLLAAVLFFASGQLSSNWGFWVLLLCPMMHLRMHRNMHSGSHAHNCAATPERPPQIDQGKNG